MPTLLCRVRYVFANELHDAIGDGNTLLHRQHASNHIDEHGIESLLADELYALPIRMLLDELGALYLDLADRDHVLLVRRE